MFCVKKATMPLLFDNPFTSFRPPQGRSHGGAFGGSAFANIFCAQKFLLTYIKKNNLKFCFTPKP